MRVLERHTSIPKVGIVCQLPAAEWLPHEDGPDADMRKGGVEPTTLHSIQEL